LYGAFALHESNLKTKGADLVLLMLSLAILVAGSTMN
jgi:hypothetical protein